MEDPDRQSSGGSEASGPAGQGKAEQWVLTFGDNGEITKVERFEPETGERKELSEEEYAAVYGTDSSGASDYYGGDASGLEGYRDYAGLDPSTYEAAYYHGVSDAIEAGYGSSGMSTEEMAYYQGMQDYITYCT